MAKQKEIKFRRDGKLFYGQQNGVKYSIHEARRLHEDESEQYYVSVNYPSERHRSFTTNGYRTFDLDGAKAFCQQVAAGEFDPAPILAAQAAAKAEREKAALEHAAKQAAEFQGKLDAHRLDFSTLLELIHCYELHVGDQARLLLTEWEQQKRSLTPIKTPCSANSLRESTPVCTVTRSTRTAAPSSRTWWLISWLRAA